MINCLAIYTNKSLNESCVEHSVMLKGVFKLSQSTDQKPEPVGAP